MNKRLIRLTESDLHKIVKESVQTILSETYKGDLYHFTNLEGMYGILESNSISLMVTGDDEYDENDEAVCLSRSGVPYIGYNPDTEYGIIFRITLDTEKMSSSIRGMKIKPWSMNNPRSEKWWDGKFHSVTDFEERAYQNIHPLNLYCKSIDVYPDKGIQKRSEVNKPLHFDEEQIKILNKLKKDFPQWNKFFNF